MCPGDSIGGGVSRVQNTIAIESAKIMPLATVIARSEKGVSGVVLGVLPSGLEPLGLNWAA